MSKRMSDDEFEHVSDNVSYLGPGRVIAEARRARKRVADLEQALERILMLVEGHDGSAADDALATVARFATRALYGVDRD